MTDPTASSHHLPLRIFVVENHPDTMQALSGYLESLGHQVTKARSQAEALALLPDADCDLLISDIGLPDGSGWELMERADLPSSVYCVAMSGFGANADRLKSRAAGFRRHLLKPFNPEELDAIIDDAASERLALR
jgi:CheY-like chemotaxis protein